MYLAPSSGVEDPNCYKTLEVNFLTVFIQISKWYGFDKKIQLHLSLFFVFFPSTYQLSNLTGNLKAKVTQRREQDASCYQEMISFRVHSMQGRQGCSFSWHKCICKEKMSENHSPKENKKKNKLTNKNLKDC